MRDSYSTIDDESDASSVCPLLLQRYNPRKNPEDFLLLISVGAMSVGLALLCIGFVIPRDYEFDPSLPARDMEAIEVYYANLTWALDICIISGMSCIAFGALIVSSLITYELIISSAENSKKKQYDSDKDKIIASEIEMTSYGTREDSQQSN